MERIEKTNKTRPAPERTLVAGLLDEMKFSRGELILRTTENKRIVVKVSESKFQEMKEFFGEVLIIIGVAYFTPGGNLSYVKMENFGVEDKSSKFFSAVPENLTMKHQILRQLREGKKPNPIDDIFGKWPGQETDEEFEKMLKDLD
ncbi:MAG: hypothetical protein HRU80_14790 [Ignavibacteriales bacterium]|nr:MAG: hypothetical protein HRU80_14790 [Ignavibacteriales bacterium]